MAEKGPGYFGDWTVRRRLFLKGYAPRPPRNTFSVAEMSHSRNGIAEMAHSHSIYIHDERNNKDDELLLPY